MFAVGAFLIFADCGKHPPEWRSHDRETREEADRKQQQGEIIARYGIAQMDDAAKGRELPHAV